MKNLTEKEMQLVGGGALGAPITVRIRGTGSVNSNSQPLYVIDGVPVEGQGS